MFARITGAAFRGILVAMLFAMPTLILPASATESPEIILFIALLGSALAFSEYASLFPSFVEFRNAPPINRMRFAAVAVTVGALSLLAAHPLAPTGLTALVQRLGGWLGGQLDFAYSPVQLAVLMMPPQISEATVLMVRDAAGLACSIAGIAIAVFALVIRVGNWPVGNGAFNVWVNLPLFDPTAGGDVVQRLQRDGRINIVGGVLLPFALPAAVKLTSGLVDPGILAAPHMLVWAISAWALMPASMIMRGLAMLRIAGLIAQKRRAACSDADKALQTA
ncbi:hypothetical protein K3722_01515 [Leisingera caerulea]|uniref:Uncharacterized protein n=1 Tax=Leisingera caerulea TaxID=506591 RepID=A0ABY5WXJ1_LEICA|nr:hypothetical protein [Leisingera caerulea]UWQ50154.1 hypothetical protein K3720_01735 [Leisingera caerulea]UWQ58838.1 hypothetical protein K3722_01515 [Leisingera caerulea]